MELRNFEAILFHPMDFEPGRFHGAVGRTEAKRQADEAQGWRGDGWGECIQPQDHEPNKLG